MVNGVQLAGVGVSLVPGSGGGGSGTVTTVSVVSANGLAGAVANATTTPAITLSTTITGILSGNGTAISAASTTGSGAVVLADTPTLITPVLGVAAATSINKVAITAPATSATLTIANGKTLTANSSLTLAGTDAKTLTVSSSGTLAGGDAFTLAIAASKTLTVSNSLTLAGTDGTVMTFPSVSASIPGLAVANTFSAAQTIAGGTLNGTLLNLTQTWGGTGTYTGISYNVTDSGPANAASLLADLLVGGVSKFNVDKSGSIIFTGSILQGATPFAIRANNRSIMGFSNALWAQMRTDATFGWSSSTDPVSSGDLFLLRDAANTLAQRNGTNAQSHNLYDTYTSGTDYHRIAIKTARATLSGVTGASVTATGVIPDGAVVVGVTTKVTTGLGTGSGTTGYQVGDGSDADRWGAIVGTIAGTSSDNTNWTAGTIQAFTAASDVVITATGGNFDGTGVIYVSVQYLIGQAD